MKIIKELSEMIEEELDGAEQYAKMAVALREEHPSLAKAFYEISTDEMRHIEILHSEVTRLIENHRREHGEPPAAMMAVYEFLHGRHIEKANSIKMYQAHYREKA
jgi:rubrerythrin